MNNYQFVISFFLQLLLVAFFVLLIIDHFLIQLFMFVKLFLSLSVINVTSKISFIFLFLFIFKFFNSLLFSLEKMSDLISGLFFRLLFSIHLSYFENAFVFYLLLKVICVLLFGGEESVHIRIFNIKASFIGLSFFVLFILFALLILSHLALKLL
jgi:hypothetical protein